MPELSDKLLALTGISSATYLVLRSKENDPPIEEAQKANSADTGIKPALSNTVFTTDTCLKKRCHKNLEWPNPSSCL